MELPPLNSTEGAYWYLISLIVLTALVVGVYLVAVMAGLAPEPGRLISVGTADQPVVAVDGPIADTVNPPPAGPRPMQ